MPQAFWRVNNYIARQWYEQEYGKVEFDERWYWNALVFLEDYGQGLINEKATAAA